MAIELFTIRETGPALRLIVESSDGRTCSTFGDFPEAIERGNAQLIAEAFNVATRTGKTPGQLETEATELRAALANLISYSTGNGSNREGNPYCKHEVRSALETLGRATGQKARNWSEVEVLPYCGPMPVKP